MSSDFGQTQEEKFEEKQEEKFDEKEREKHEEKGQSDPLSGVIAAAILIWAGVVLLAVNLGFLGTFTGILDGLGIRTWEVPWEVPFISPRVFPVFFIGAGLILLVEIVLRLILPGYRRRVLGTVIAAVVFFALAFGQWDVIWPLILIVVGLSLVLGVLIRKR